MTSSDRPFSILHVVVGIAPTTEQFNEHCLPFAQERDIAICSFLKATVTTPPEIALFEGDGTVRGFWRALGGALDQREYDVIHVHAPQTGTIVLLASLVRRRPLRNLVLTIHNSFHNFSRRNRLLMFPALAFYPRAVFCSHAALASFPRSLRGLGNGRFTVIQNGVDIDRIDRVLGGFAPQPDPETFTVASVGRLIPRKDPLALLQAFDRGIGDDGRLIFVGGGELQEVLWVESARLGCSPRIQVTGLVPRDDVYRHVARADVCVSASYGEGLPVAVLEAMACGRPVILSDIPPHREIAVDADFIPLVRPGDVGAFARELRRFRDMSPRRRAEIGDRCRKLAAERFSLQVMHRTYRDVYARMLNGRAVVDGSGNLRVAARP
jgi:glycosyltransferase involved in cell wall biosynthesis